MSNVPPGFPPLTRRDLGRISLLAGLGVGGAAILSACGPSPTDQQGQTTPGASSTSTASQSTVVVAMTKASEPTAGFNPIFGWGCGEHVHEPLIQSTLIVTDTDLGFVNDLATDYSASEDGLTWRFRIRDDVHFSNGAPLRPTDVAFTINKIIDSPGAVADLTMVRAVEVSADDEIVLHLTKPFNALLYTLAVVGIVPEAGYTDSYGEQPIGSGRYQLERWDRGQQAIFVANPDYYGPTPAMQRMVVVFMDEDAALAGVRAGEIDIAYTSALFSDLQISGYELLSVASVDSRGISLPTQRAGGSRTEDGTSYPLGNDVTADLALRRAMSYALSRDAMISGVLSGHGTPAFNVSDGTPWSNPELAYQTDLAKAQQLLAEAGWVPGGDGVLVKDGLRAELRLFYPASDSTRQGLASEFANQMAQIGVQVNPTGRSWDEIYQAQFSDPVLWGWGANTPSEMYNLYYSTGWGNFAGFDDATIDAHLDAALAEPEIEASYQHWRAAQWDGSTGIGVQAACTWIWFANIDHLYFGRTGLDIGQQKLHPHGHGWSLVNNVDQWRWG